MRPDPVITYDYYPARFGEWHYMFRLEFPCGRVDYAHSLDATYQQMYERQQGFKIVATGCTDPSHAEEKAA